MGIKENLKKMGDLLFYGILALFVMQKIPSIVAMYKVQGEMAHVQEITTLDGSKISLPLPQRRHLVVFWATWCGPCGIELKRINKLIQSQDIKKEQVIAVSIGEESFAVRKSVKENNFQFTVALDPQGEFAKKYKVAGTPTLVLIDEYGKVDWMTTGLSASLELRLKRFLKN